MKNRRSFLTRISAFLATLGIGAAGARASASPRAGGQQTARTISTSGRGPLFASAKAHGNVLYLAGKGAHFDGDIKAHTDHVLNELEKELKKNGSSMEKVLKVNVYLNDLADYSAMNEVYRGRFGANPPVRTTVACAAGIPGNSLVEIDCIAALD